MYHYIKQTYLSLQQDNDEDVHDEEKDDHNVLGHIPPVHIHCHTLNDHKWLTMIGKNSHSKLQVFSHQVRRAAIILVTYPTAKSNNNKCKNNSGH